jgi:hypothetical protein
VTGAATRYLYLVRHVRARRRVTLGSTVRVKPGPGKAKPQVIHLVTWGSAGALGGIRTPNLLIRSQMLYPLSYERLDDDEQEYTRRALTS